MLNVALKFWGFFLFQLFCSRNVKKPCLLINIWSGWHPNLCQNIQQACLANLCFFLPHGLIFFVTLCIVVLTIEYFVCQFIFILTWRAIINRFVIFVFYFTCLLSHLLGYFFLNFLYFLLSLIGMYLKILVNYLYLNFLNPHMGGYILNQELGFLEYLNLIYFNFNLGIGYLMYFYRQDRNNPYIFYHNFCLIIFFWKIFNWIG